MLLWLFLAMLANQTYAQESQQSCFVEIPVFDARGNPLPFEIKSVMSEQGDINLLTTEQKDYRMTAYRDKLYFSERLLGRSGFDITLEYEKRKLRTRIALMACQQRTSLQYGSLDTGADVAWSVVKGRVSGCQFSGEWWIRAVPMFGGHEGISYHEGYIHPADGAFHIVSSMGGGRHIVVIGKGKDPVRVVGFDVFIGGKNEMGTVDLAGTCPN